MQHVGDLLAGLASGSVCTLGTGVVIEEHLACGGRLVVAEEISMKAWRGKQVVVAAGVVEFRTNWRN